ncbi:hypothetical protein [Marivivens aquimaris]|uniref:hypothetical protein n=1 Tax=Marivivens aquimaris TaxID=2774876 RepID=UPI0018800F94|nr:hypothetical protein [Marivivens aquimaris]
MKDEQDTAGTRVELLPEHRALLKTVVKWANARPTDDDLRDATLLEDWMLYAGRGDIAFAAHAVMPDGARSTLLTTRAIIAIDNDLKWAFVEDGYVRLGRRLGDNPELREYMLCAQLNSVPEVQALLKAQTEAAAELLLRCDPGRDYDA